MAKWIVTIVIAVGLVSGMSLPVTAQTTVSGVWVGEVVMPGQNFTLRFDIAPADSGIAVVMDVPESKLIRFPAPKASFENNRLHVEVPPGWGLAMFRDIGLAPDEQIIRFEGSLIGDSMPGSVTIAYATLPLTLRRLSASRSSPVIREEVSFSNGDVQLAGTLFKPRGQGPFGVTVFTHGSGDQLRDAYAREAEALATAGVAALVYDKRGAGRSTGANWRVASFEELASDARAAVDYLSTRPDIDRLRIGLFGLSQGTWLIGMVARDRPRIAFLIFVSGSGIPVWEQEIYRTGAMMRAYGFSDPDIQQAQEFQDQKFQVARTGLGWPQLDSLTQRLRGSAKWFDDFANEYASLASARFWWLAVYHHDPVPLLRTLRMPVLGLFGENDLSFPIPKVKANMEQAFGAAGNCDVTMRIFPGAEHQLMVPQRYLDRTLRRTVTPEFLPMLVSWVRAHALASHRPCSPGRR
jgi:pimeloyl-ACP methyl ester carboxylesterase